MSPQLLRRAADAAGLKLRYSAYAFSIMRNAYKAAANEKERVKFATPMLKALLHFLLKVRQRDRLFEKAKDSLWREFEGA